MNPTLTQRQPAIVVGTITTAVASILAVLVAFGIDFTQGQQVAILGVIAGVGPLVAAFVTRSQVAPMVSVAALVDSTGVVVAGPAASQADGAPVDVVPVL